MNNLRSKVLAFLRDLPKDKRNRYSEALALYRQSEGQNPASYTGDFTDQNLKFLLYDLQKLNKVKDVEILRKETVAAPAIEGEGGNDQDEESGLYAAGNIHPEGSLATAGPGNSTEGESGTADQQNGEAVKMEVVRPQEAFVAAPDSEERKKLQDEFPFLAEPSCPIELRALVTDKVSAYRKYVAAHNKLQAHRNGVEIIGDENELQETIKAAVDDYTANRAIYDELNHYATSGKVLGKHPIFRTLQLQREVAEMDNKELVAFLNSSKKFFSTKKKDLELAKDDAGKVAKINASIAARKEKLALVEAALKLNGGK